MGPEFLASVMREGFIPIAECIVGHSNRRTKFSRDRLPPVQNSRVAASMDTQEDSTDDPMHLEQPGSRVIILLPKLNRLRCVLRCEDAHVAKNARKRSNRFSMTVNQSFDEVLILNTFICACEIFVSETISNVWLPGSCWLCSAARRELVVSLCVSCAQGDAYPERRTARGVQRRSLF